MVYPLKKKLIAECRLEIEKKRYEDAGYKVTVFEIEEHGIDMVAENDKEVIGIEVINWNRRGYTNQERFDSWVNHWDKHEEEVIENKDDRTYKRRLIYSYADNIKDFLKKLFDLGVELEMKGTQDLPKVEAIRIKVRGI